MIATKKMRRQRRNHSDHQAAEPRSKRLEQRRFPFEKGSPPRGRGIHWVKPELVAEIAFAEWTQNHLLRQPRFEGLRPDKKPKDCRRERPKATSA